jgi:hypothetical protein
MERHSDIDRLRDALEGRLDAAERARLERDLAADAGLAELAERLRDVYALTAAEDAPPPCRVTFEDLERHLTPPVRAWQRRAAAAALILGAGAAGVWLSQRSGPVALPEAAAEAPMAPAPSDEPPVVSLAHLRLPGEVAPDAVERAWVPEVLARFDPRAAVGFAWLRDQREAMFVSRAARRPILVLGSLPGCPWCERLRSEVCADSGVQGLADLYVPLEWNLGDLPEKEFGYVKERRGYPLLEVWSVEDEVVLNFSGQPDARLFEEMLLQGLDRTGVADHAPPWADLRDWAARWLAADRARAAGRMAEAVAGWRELARRAQGNVLAEQAVLALREVDAEAGAALAHVRELAARDPVAARGALSAALEHFAGTDAAPDLEAVRSAWAPGGVFPTLQWAPDAQAR